MTKGCEVGGSVEVVSGWYMVWDVNAASLNIVMICKVSRFVLLSELVAALITSAKKGSGNAGRTLVIALSMFVLSIDFSNGLLQLIWFEFS